MEEERVPKSGEIYHHFKGNLYQIITVATHTETGEQMVVYQALYGEFRTFARPLSLFAGVVDSERYPDVKQKMRFELWKRETVKEPQNEEQSKNEKHYASKETDIPADSTYETMDTIEGIRNNSIRDNILDDGTEEKSVNPLLIQFLEADSNNRKLEVVTSNLKFMNHRLINDMAVSMDCTIDEGPLDQRIQHLITSLQTMSKFEDRRLR